jgi:hypothetical protein
MLRLGRDRFDSPLMQEAYNTAYLLVMLQRRQKEEDAREFRAALDSNAGSAGVGIDDPCSAFLILLTRPPLI